MNAANCACSAGDAARPRRARAKMRRRRLQRAEVGVTLGQAMIGQPAPVRVEIIVPLPAALRGSCTRSRISMSAASSRRLTHSLNWAGWCTASALSGRNVGQHPRRQPGSRQRPVVLQAVGRVIGRAQRDDLEPLENALRAQLRRGQLLAGFLPDPRRALLVQQLINAEVALQLQVGPVVQRVAQRVRHGGRPGLEFLERLGRAGAIALRHPVGAHRPPLVVVPLQPDLEQVLELPVLRDVPRRQVAMIIKDRLRLRELVIEPRRRPGVQEKVFVNEFHTLVESQKPNAITLQV